MNTSYSIFPPAAKAAVRLPKVGDVLTGSFGYDADLPHWFKVVKVTAATVGIVALETTRAYTSGGGMYWTETPVDITVGGVKTKRFRATENGYRVKESSIMTLFLGDMEPREGYNVH